MAEVTLELASKHERVQPQAEEIAGIGIFVARRSSMIKDEQWSQWGW